MRSPNALFLLQGATEIRIYLRPTVYNSHDILQGSAYIPISGALILSLHGGCNSFHIIICTAVFIIFPSTVGGHYHHPCMYYLSLLC